jgi:glycerophosphoryl diester phosphodiesterase
LVLFVAKPLIIAHRGASAEAPENTLAAFRRAVALKADGIELDVQITADGVPVVFHDPGLLRLTGRRGRLAAKTWLELKNLRVLESPERISRLVDVLTFTRRRIVVQIELKRGATVAPVVAAIKKARASAWVILASFELDLLREATEFAPGIPRMLISEGRRSRATLLRQLEACAAHGLSVNHRAIRTADYASWFQARGFAVWCWTVNDARTARQLAGWGIDGLLGDNPALLKREV